MSEKKRTGKTLLIIGLLLAVIGLSLFIGGMTVNHWDFSKMSTVQLQDNEYECNENTTDVTIRFLYSDIRVERSETAAKIKITYPITVDRKENPVSFVEIREEDGAITLNESGKFLWEHQFFSVHIPKAKLVITLPADGTHNLDLHTECGDIIVKKGDYARLTADTDLGEVHVTEATFTEEINLQTDCGDIIMKNIRGEKTVIATTNLGTIESEFVTAPQINLSADSGDLEILFLAGNNIRLETDLGDIEGTITGSEKDFTISAGTNLGSCNLTNRTGGSKNLFVHTGLGDIEIFFQN